MQALIAWLRKQIEPVPPDIAVCEFRCRQPQCRVTEWENCSRRAAFGVATRSNTDPPLRREA